MAFAHYPVRKSFADLCRTDKNKVELSKNHAPWIEKFWPSTTYPEGYAARGPYCAAGLVYWMDKWLELPETLDVLKMTRAEAEKWRCKDASAYGWTRWAKAKGLQILTPKNTVLRMSDIVVYNYSHIELVTDDDGTPNGPFTAIGFNTNAAGSRDGEGCFEKPRTRKAVREFIRIIPS